MAQVIKKATRESFGMALCELAKTNNDIIVFDADLAAATKTGIFKKVTRLLTLILMLKLPAATQVFQQVKTVLLISALKISVLCVQFRVWLSLTLPITTK